MVSFTRRITKQTAEKGSNYSSFPNGDTAWLNPQVITLKSHGVPVFDWESEDGGKMFPTKRLVINSFLQLESVAFVVASLISTRIGRMLEFVL